MIRRIRAVALLTAVAGALGAVAPVPAEAGPPRSFYGVNTQRLPTTAEIDRMGVGRVGTLRIQLRWSAVDKTSEPGDYDWSEVDQIVAAAARNRIRVLPFLYSTPPWVANTLDRRTDCGQACHLYPPASRAALVAWAWFVHDLVGRYGPNGDFWAEHPEVRPLAIRSWQIWNEPNSPPFFRPRPDVDQYARLLSTASQVMRARDPGAQIVLAGMYGFPLNGDPPAMLSFDFLRELYRQPKIKKQFDGVAVHPYAAGMPGVRHQIRRTRKVMRRHGDRRTPIWVTEIGWASAGRRNPLAPGPGKQAKRVRQVFGQLGKGRRRTRIKRVIWFSWRDDTIGTAVCSWCDYSGLVREHSLAPKRSWRAFRQFTGGR